MTTFTPSIAPGQARGDHSSNDPAERFFSYTPPIPTGVTIWQDNLGVWHEEQHPYHGGDTTTVHDGDTTTITPPIAGLANAQRVYQGGHIYHIDLTSALLLIAAGFGSGINVASVDTTWNTEDLAPLDSKMLLTADGSHATAPPTIDGNAFKVQLNAGTTQGSSTLREFFLHSDTAGWTDSHGIIEIDPPAYGSFGGVDILPQMGVVLRAQFNSSTGKNQGITLNNGTIFGIPTLNIGAWHAFPDGTGFNNRQFSFPFFDPNSFFTDGFNLPYGWEWELINNIIRVRSFKVGARTTLYGLDPSSISWTDPVRSRTLNLDTDCGDPGVVPTPTGPGTAGIIVAHLGRDSRSAARIRRFEMDRIS